MPHFPLASEVKATDRPRPYRHAARIGIALVGDEEHVRRRLGRGGHVAAQGRDLIPADFLDDLVTRVRVSDRPEGLLDDGGLAGQLGLQGEDARDAVDVVGVVEAAPPQRERSVMKRTSASLPMATAETVILSFCIRRTKAREVRRRAPPRRRGR